MKNRMLDTKIVMSLTDLEFTLKEYKEGNTEQPELEEKIERLSFLHENTKEGMSRFREVEMPEMG